MVNNELDYEQLVLFTKQEILRSNLRRSAVAGTGLRLLVANPRATGRLIGPPLLVQIVSVTEIIRPNRPRVHKLKLTDGDNSINAIACVSSLGHNLSFYNLHIGYKVSQSHRYPSQHHI